MTSTVVLTISSLSVASALQGLMPPSLSRTQASKRPLLEQHALIYGWDDDGTDDDNNTPAPYTEWGTESADCPASGVAVAESLSYDQDRVGSLARLAVAFAPPGQGLELDQIEKIDVICVRNDRIDIQAIICEDGGCVSLAVPVRFPYACESNGEWLQGCVVKNLDELDVSAKSTLDQRRQQGDTSDLNVPVTEFPTWWVAPSYDAALDGECTFMRTILNEDDFASDILALAQDSLYRASSGEVVKAARVAAVGPAGLGFKVRAETALGSPALLDVFYPFGGEPLKDVESLRAAVLGAVATAEG